MVKSSAGALDSQKEYIAFTIASLIFSGFLPAFSKIIFFNLSYPNSSWLLFLASVIPSVNKTSMSLGLYFILSMLTYL